MRAMSRGSTERHPSRTGHPRQNDAVRAEVDGPGSRHPGDAVPWQQAWQDALYGADGFYRRAAPAAHFATSAQGIPGGGALLAEAVASLARASGCTAVVDLGCGRGELLTHLRALDPTLHLTGVDVVDQPEGLDVDAWLVSPGSAGLPEDLRGLTRTLVLAHEWLDVVPCPVVQRDERGVWREVTVAVEDADEVERPGRSHPVAVETSGAPPSGADLAWARRWLGPEVQRAEIGLPRDEAFADLLSRVSSGLVVAVDYGHTSGERPPHGSLTGYRDGRQVQPVPNRETDLTAHVAVDSLPGARLVRQRDLLRELEVVTERPDRALAQSNPVAYLQALTAAGAAGAACRPGALGDFWWMLRQV